MKQPKLKLKDKRAISLRVFLDRIARGEVALKDLRDAGKN
jgi:hypothetical protein